MKKYYFLSFVFLGLIFITFSCKKDKRELSPEEQKLQELRDKYSDYDTIILGKKLTSPHSLEIMTQAYNNLHPGVLSEGEMLKPNFLYVKFKPENLSDYSVLTQNGVELTPYPLNYELIGKGWFYYDPEVPTGQMTYYYSVVPIDYSFFWVEYEILFPVYMPDLNTEHDLQEEAYKIANQIDGGINYYPTI